MRYNNIYILAPFKKTTGGIELSHQLADYLKNSGQNSYIVYVEKEKIVSIKDVTEAYSCYNIEIATEIEDDPKNILILPETFYDFIFLYTKIQIGCWWMSVDNRYIKTTFKEAFRFANSFDKKWNVTKRFIVNKSSFSRNDNNTLREQDKRIVHFYQSAYAQHHLYSIGFSHVLPLSDYINTEVIGHDLYARKNLVLYNPKKGIAFTQKIIATCKDCGFAFVPLTGLSRKELSELMMTAKLYIDFGEFPGKDRMPREAVLNGCCILTGKLGASKFYEDVAIPDDYKIDTRIENISLVRNRIEYIINHFKSCTCDMDYYRKRILKEKEIFFSEVNDAFSL